MDEFRELSSLRNFTMLSQKLYFLFIQYIRNGRIRAPPENDLACLKSTFQAGAKTDRRALQSKFKSWAKRMKVFGDKLELLTTEKEIIPVEKCNEIVMQIHSDAHLSVDRVIVKIQQKYTWSKKNFGLDRTTVTDCIYENCSNPECRRQIENEVSKRFSAEKLIRDVILASESPLGRFQNHQFNPISSITMNDLYSTLSPAPLYPLPMLLTLQSDILPKENYNLYFQDTNEIKNIVPKNYPCCEKGMKEQKIIEPFSRETPRSLRKILTSMESSEQCIPEKPKRIFKSSPIFRKPKNIHEFKVLMKASELSPITYPLILKEEKTKFLGNLGVVPKMICSKRTLLKFEREKRRRRVLEKQHLMYHKNRKNLRDRNKLNKIKLKEQRDKRAYLELSRRQTCLLAKSSSSGFEKPIAKNEDSEVKILKIVPPTKTNEPEIIEISSSEEDCQSSEKLFSMKKGNRENSNYLKKNKMLTYKKAEDSHDSIIHDWNLSFKKEQNPSSIPSTSTKEVYPNTVDKISQQSSFKAYLKPLQLKGEVAVLPASQSLSIKSLRGKKLTPFISDNQVISNTYNSKLMRKNNFYSILQPISNATKLKIVEQSKLKPFHFKVMHNNTKAFGEEKSKNIVQVSNSAATILSKVPQSFHEEYDGKITSVIIASSKCKNVPIQCRDQNLNSLKMEKREMINSEEIMVRNKRYIDEEMSKLLKWIKMMRFSMAPSLFYLNIQRTQKLETQLNTGIVLVRNIRRKLLEIEKLEKSSY